MYSHLRTTTAMKLSMREAFIKGDFTEMEHTRGKMEAVMKACGKRDLEKEMVFSQPLMEKGIKESG